MVVSENLAGEIKSPAIEIAGPSFALQFDGSGDLTPWPF
jgi:hypothetical protein